MDSKEISFEVRPYILDERYIKLETLVDDVRQDFYSRLIDTQDRAIREALMRLGWTPPQDLCAVCKQEIPEFQVAFGPLGGTHIACIDKAREILANKCPEKSNDT